MMKLQTVLLLSILFSSFSHLFSQKEKSSRIRYYFTSLPQKKLPNSFQTYSVVFDGTGLVQAGKSSLDCERQIKMDAFKRIEQFNEFGHLRIQASMEEVYSDEREYKTKKNVRKDKKTGEEVVSYSHWFVISFHSTITYTIYNLEGEVMFAFEDIQKGKSETHKYKTRSILNSNFDNQFIELRTAFAEKVLQTLINTLQSKLSNTYDFDFRYTWGEIFSVKKHPLQAEFDRYVELTRTQLQSLASNYTPEQLQVVREAIDPAIEFWLQQGNVTPNQPGLKNKALKAIRATYSASHLNLAYLYFYLYDNLEEAEKHARLVLAAEGKNRKASNLLKYLETTRQRMNLHQIYTLHFQPDLSQAMAPHEITALNNQKATIEEAYFSQEAFIQLGNEQIAGTMIIDKAANELSFGANGSTKFVTDANGEMLEYNLDQENITAFSMGKRKFIKLRFAPCAKGKEEAQIHILEIIYESEKITLFRYYPPTNGLDDQSAEYAFQKTGEEHPISLFESTFLLWNKGIANYFKSCPDLQDLCASGDIELKEADLIKAARIYTELCN